MNGAVLSEWSSERGVEEGGGRLKAGGRIFWQRIGEIMRKIMGGKEWIGRKPSAACLNLCSLLLLFSGAKAQVIYYNHIAVIKLWYALN